MNKAVVADRGQSPLAVNDLGLNFPLTVSKGRRTQHETMKYAPQLDFTVNMKLGT
jgi:hypothetical protein